MVREKCVISILSTTTILTCDVSPATTHRGACTCWIPRAARHWNIKERQNGVT